MILELERTFITVSLLEIKDEMLYFWPLWKMETEENGTKVQCCSTPFFTLTLSGPALPQQ